MAKSKSIRHVCTIDRKLDGSVRVRAMVNGTIISCRLRLAYGPSHRTISHRAESFWAGLKEVCTVRVKPTSDNWRRFQYDCKRNNVSWRIVDDTVLTDKGYVGWTEYDYVTVQLRGSTLSVDTMLSHVARRACSWLVSASSAFAALPGNSQSHLSRSYKPYQKTSSKSNQDKPSVPSYPEFPPILTIGKMDFWLVQLGDKWVIANHWSKRKPIVHHSKDKYLPGTKPDKLHGIEIDGIEEFHKEKEKGLSPYVKPQTFLQYNPETGQYHRQPIKIIGSCAECHKGLATENDGYSLTDDTNTVVGYVCNGCAIKLMQEE